jgi:hypothetical protein
LECKCGNKYKYHFKKFTTNTPQSRGRVGEPGEGWTPLKIATGILSFSFSFSKSASANVV